MDGEKMKRDQLDLLANSLHQMRSQGSFTDVTFECEGGIIQAHRNVLSASCNYFEAMFRNALSETNTGKVQLHGTNIKVMDIIIKFLYTGSLESLNDDVPLLKQVMSTAHMMQINSLLQFSSKALVRLLSLENYIEFWELAKRFGQTEMLVSILQFINRSFTDLEASGSFVLLTFDQMTDLLVDASDKQNVDKLVAIILQWVRNNSEERLSEMTQLFHNLNLKELSSKYLYQLTEDALVKQSPEVLHRLFTISTVRLLNHERPIQALTLPFRIHFLRFHTEASTKIQTYFTREKAWSAVRDIPDSVCSFFGICSLASYLYFISEGSNSLIQYHPDSDHAIAHALPSNIEPGWKLLFSFGKNVYVNTDEDFLSFNIETQKWKPLPPLDIENVFFASTRDSLFICNNMSDTIQKYNTEDDTCTLVTRNPEVRNHSCAVSGGKLYFYKKDGALNVYDPSVDQWEQIELDNGEGKCMVSIHYDVPFLIFYQGNNCNCQWMYDPVIGSWAQLTRRMKFLCWNKCLITVE